MVNLSCHHHSHHSLCHHRVYPCRLLVCHVLLYDRGHDRRGSGIDLFHDLGRGLGRGLGLAYRSLVHAGHLYVGSNHHVRDEEKASGLDEGGGFGHDGLVDHGRNRNARMQTGECEPTIVKLEKQEGGFIAECHTSIFNKSSRPIRLLCISWYASSASRRLSYSTNAKLIAVRKNYVESYEMTSELTDDWMRYVAQECRSERGARICKCQ